MTNDFDIKKARADGLAKDEHGTERRDANLGAATQRCIL